MLPGVYIRAKGVHGYRIYFIDLSTNKITICGIMRPFFIALVNLYGSYSPSLEA
jgi:hypothetical protein